MFKDLLARFRKVLTVAEWKQEAQDAMMRKEFVVASLDELHRVERAAAEGGQDRIMSRQPNQQIHSNQHQMPVDNRRQKPSGVNHDREYKKNDLALADLMNAIRQQQINE